MSCLFHVADMFQNGQSTPYAKTKPQSARLCINSAVVNHSVNACVASDLVCSSNCNSYAKNMQMGRAPSDSISNNGINVVFCKV